MTVVAHSLGGAIAVTWAEQHRQDVAGVVLVDATPPGYLREFLDRLPDGSSGDAGSVRDGIRALLSPRRNAEHLDVADLVEGPDDVRSAGRDASRAHPQHPATSAPT